MKSVYVCSALLSRQPNVCSTKIIENTTRKKKFLFCNILLHYYSTIVIVLRSTSTIRKAPSVGDNARNVLGFLDIKSKQRDRAAWDFSLREISFPSHAVNHESDPNQFQVAITVLCEKHYESFH
uniref:Uncharacterized protein n=1 Tax=Glossina palpalis gambiensis TaxID=67801 RepID=A0A1B0BI04_9MUSC